MKRQHHGRRGSHGNRQFPGQNFGPNFGNQNPYYGGSQSTAQAASHTHGVGPNGQFQNANALAGAQGDQRI